MKVFSQLEKAQLENTTSDTGSLPKGMITYRTDLNIAKVSNGTSMLALIDESSTQILSNKTYASPITTGAIQGAQIATPANPSAGNNKLYFKSDGKLYTLDSSGNEAAVGSGTGGVKNLITNGNADDTASSIFVPYADTASTRPVDGTGGSPTVTTSITTTTPLDGVKSFLLTKPASNVQGQGWAVPFTVDPAYRAKSLKISVDYIINSGTFVAGGAGVESDVIWYIYDVTNSQLIEPSNIKMFSNNSSIADKFEATFQTSATGASYRLIAHIQSTSALAYELKVDNVTVSPQSYVFGTPVTDLINTFTPTIGGLGTGGVSTASIKWGRHGDLLVGRLTWTKDGSAGSGASTVTMTLPFTVDSTKVNGTGDVVGNGYSSNGTVFQARLNGVYNQINLIRADTSATLTGSDVGANRAYYIDLIFPVSGWSSSVQTSDNADTRITTARVTAAGSTSIAGAAVPTKMVFGTIVYDTHGAYSTGNSRFIAPTSGFYKIAASVRYDTAAWTLNNRLDMYVYKNGSAYSYLKSDVIHSTGSYYPGSLQGDSIVQMSAGDYLEVFLVNPEATARNTIADASINFVTFEKLTGPSAIAASETVAIKYYDNAGTTINTSNNTKPFATKVYDTHNAFVGSTGIFTAPIAGKYAFSVKHISSTALAANDQWNFFAYKNSAVIVATDVKAGTGATNTFNSVHITGDIDLLAGETLQFNSHTALGTLSLTSTSGYNQVSIHRVGN